MNARVAIIAALPREIAGLVRGTQAEPTLLKQGIHLHELPVAVVVAAGMGESRVAYAVEAAMACGPVSTLISMGLAGACSPALSAGTVLEAAEVVNAHTGERFATNAMNAQHVLVTTSIIASVQEKARLFAAYHAAAVDMEAATVARLARAHGLKFRAIKGISDAHDFELASLDRFIGRHGHFRTGAFALHTTLRPHLWAKAAHLGKMSNRALAALTETLQVELNLKGR